MLKPEFYTSEYKHTGRPVRYIDSGGTPHPAVIHSISGEKADLIVAVDGEWANGIEWRTVRDVLLSAEPKPRTFSYLPPTE